MIKLTKVWRTGLQVMMVILMCTNSGWTQQSPGSSGVTSGFSSGGSGLGNFSTGGVPSIRSQEPPAVVSTNGMTTNTTQAILEPINKPNDFQKYILETTGQRLPIFGQNFFDANQPSQRPLSQQNQSSLNNTFAPLDSGPVSLDYVLGPGDQLIVRGWGSIDIDVRAAIDRNGMLSLPRVGSVTMLGVKVAHAESVIRKAIGKYYKDFELSVTLGQIRAVTVYVVGQAKKPGSYLLSNVSTLSSALFSTGGPNSNGSMRRIQLKRAGQVIAELDLYDFLSKGNNAADVKLVDGDVIFIPPAEGYLAIIGKINTKAIYEIKDGKETLSQFLEIAGGLPVIADLRRITLERLVPAKSQPRNIIEFALDGESLKTTLKSGDTVTVHAISPELDNAVTLRGNVAQPARMAWREGMRLRDLIPDREALISRDSIRRQNEVLFDAAQRERTQREREMIPDDLLDDKEINERLLKDPRYMARFIPGITQTYKSTTVQPQSSLNGSTPTINTNAQNSQGLVIPDINDLETYRDRRQIRLFSQQAPIAIKDKNEAASITEFVGNLYDEINWDYAVIERINRKDMSVNLIPFNLAKVLNDEKDPDNYLLKAGDIVTVFSVADIRVPISRRRIMVRVEGEVMQPGVYQAKPGETLTTILQRAGGLTQDAYLFGSALYREDVRKSQQENIQKLMRRLESESAAQIAQLSQSLGASADANLAQTRVLAAQQAQRQALERVRSVRPEGRIALGLAPEFTNFIKNLPEIKLQNGDRFVVPNHPDFVYVYGAVNTESVLLFKKEYTVSDYLKAAGMSMAADRDAVIVVRADGSALTSNGSWFGSVSSVKLMPGDAVVVPDKVDMEASWSSVIRNTKDVTQIFYQLGLGAAGLKSLGY